jgi:hypothetical protein
LAGFRRRSGIGPAIQDVEDDATVQPHGVKPYTGSQDQIDRRTIGPYCDNVSRRDGRTSQRYVVGKTNHYMITVLIELVGCLAIRIDHHSSEVGMAGRSDGYLVGFYFLGSGVALGGPGGGRRNQDHCGCEDKQDSVKNHSKLASSLSISD